MGSAKFVGPQNDGPQNNNSWKMQDPKQCRARHRFIRSEQ